MVFNTVARIMIQILQNSLLHQRRGFYFYPNFANFRLIKQ